MNTTKPQEPKAVEPTKEVLAVAMPAALPAKPRRRYRWFGVGHGLHRNQAEREEHLAAITACLQDDKQWQLHAWLHENLSILDNKANATLAVNAIALATLTIFYSTLNAKTLLFVKVGFLFAFLLLVWSIIPVARIAFVYWSTTEEFRDPALMLNALLEVRDQRTRIVRSAILKGAIAFCLFAVILAVNLATALG